MNRFCKWFPSTHVITQETFNFLDFIFPARITADQSLNGVKFHNVAQKNSMGIKVIPTN
jgi:hypothetical protein